MNEELLELKGIDEIPMFSWSTNTKEFYVLGHKLDGVNSIEDFINYIHKLDKENQQLKHRLVTANNFIEDRKENMIPEHYDDLKYIINECDLNSSW